MDMVEKLREGFGFKRNPQDLGDDGNAFVSFLNWASGNTEQAHKVQAAYKNATGNRPEWQVGEYIDWLIETQWGEDGKHNKTGL